MTETYLGIIVGTSAAILVAWVLIFKSLRIYRLLARSLFLFGLPIAIMLLDNYTLGLLISVPYLAFLALEEALKLWGSRISADDRESFALLLLMGVWELALTKSILPFVSGPDFAEFLERNVFLYATVVVVPFFMHATTAAIYTLLRKSFWLVPLIICLLIHVLFNVSRPLYFTGSDGLDGINPNMFIMDFVAFSGAAAILYWAALKLRRRDHV